jgi:LacI family transcriptional regulator, kdg operon repressor
MRKITISDVAKQANVSKSTISQYLNKRYDYMSEKTREKIDETIKKLNYQPNFVARSLKQKSTFTVGVIVANILHTFSTHIIRSIEDFLNEQDFHIIVCNADDQPEKERKYIEMLRAKQVDGIIIFPTGGNIDVYEQMKEDHFPIVFMDRTIEHLDIQSVLLDNQEASRLAIDEFVKSGISRIAIITTSLIRKTTPRIERIEGYKQALLSHGLEINPAYIQSADADELPSVINQLFEMDSPPQAILAGNDIALIEVLKFIHDRQLKIPEDVSVIGIDEVPFANFFTPPITTVAQPAKEMAREAVERLLGQIKGDHPQEEPVIKRFEPYLIVRKSSAIWE